MATYAPVAYTTAASNTQIDFDITFTFLRATDVVVSVIDPNGNVLVNGTDYDAELQTVNDGTFDMRVVQAGTLNTTRDPLAANHVVSIKRNTDISQIVTVFQDGASFKAADINAIITQLFDKIQEVEVSSGEGIGLTDDLVAFDAENKPLRNLGTPTADNDAVRKVDIDSGIGPAITTVAAISSDVTTVASGTDTSGRLHRLNIEDVADDLNLGANSDITTVATDIRTGGNNHVQAVSNSIADVNTLAGNDTDGTAHLVNIETVAEDLTGTNTIGTVAGSIANVNTLAGNDAGGTAHLTNISDLAPQASNISTLTQTANLTALQNAATNAAAAEAALNAFNRTYLGAYASDPTVDNNGDALTDGDLYFNSTSNNLKFYDAGNSQWITLNNAVQVNAASSLQAVGDVDFANAGGPNLTLAANHFIVRDVNNARWENTDAAGVKTILSIAAGDVSGLSTVATTGLYSDLSGSPTLATVATTGSYTDLLNLPTLGTAAAAETTDFLQPGDIIDNLTSTSTTDVLSAAQGKALNDNKQANITTSTALAAASLTTVTDAGNTVDVRRADRIAQASSVNVDGGATLYDVTATATLTLSDLVAGDIVTVFSRSGTTTIARGTITYAYIDGDIATNKTSVTVGAGTLATVTMVSNDTAIIAGSDLT